MLQIPWLCENEEVAGTHRHVLTQSQRACDGIQREIDREAREARGFSREELEQPIERMLRQRAEQLTAQALTQREHLTPVAGDEQEFVNSGERQLLGVDPNLLGELGLLLCSDIYRLNEHLRSGRALTEPAGAMIDFGGYTSWGDFNEQSLRLFNALADELILDSSVRAFRGIGIYEDHQIDQDPLGIAAHLLRGALLPRGALMDPGYGFMTLDERVAKEYTGNGTGYREPKHKVLLEVEVSRALCIPGPKHRSDDLFSLLHSRNFIGTAMAQLVLQPNSRFEFFSPATLAHASDGWVRLRLRQVF